MTVKTACCICSILVCAALAASASAATTRAQGDEPGGLDFERTRCDDARDTACFRMVTSDDCVSSHAYGPLGHYPVVAGMRLRAEVVAPPSDGSVPFYAIFWPNYREPDGTLLDTYEIYVRYGEPATETRFDCKAEGLSMCAMSQPGGGLKNVHVLAIAKRASPEAAIPYVVTLHHSEPYPLPQDCQPPRRSAVQRGRGG